MYSYLTVEVCHWKLALCVYGLTISISQGENQSHYEFLQENVPVKLRRPCRFRSFSILCGYKSINLSTKEENVLKTVIYRDHLLMEGFQVPEIPSLYR